MNWGGFQLFRGFLVVSNYSWMKLQPASPRLCASFLHDLGHHSTQSDFFNKAALSLMPAFALVMLCQARQCKLCQLSPQRPCLCFEDVLERSLSLFAAISERSSGCSNATEVALFYSSTFDYSSGGLSLFCQWRNTCGRWNNTKKYKLKKVLMTWKCDKKGSPVPWN